MATKLLRYEQRVYSDPEIRAAGFRIVARPKKGEAVWTDGTGNWRQSEVLAYMQRLKRRG